MNHLEVAFLGFAFMAALTVPIEVAASDEQVGDEVRVTLSYYNSSESSDGGSSSSRGSNAYVERVIAVSGSGIELEFDLPEEVPENSRLIEWQFPVRVFEAPDGSMALINVHEMEGRRDEWLAAAGLTADACGSWYFTWNAFKVECDPRSVLPLLQDLRLKSAELLEGAIYRHPTATSGAPL